MCRLFFAGPKLASFVLDPNHRQLRKLANLRSVDWRWCVIHMYLGVIGQVRGIYDILLYTCFRPIRVIVACVLYLHTAESEYTTCTCFSFRVLRNPGPGYSYAPGWVAALTKKWCIIGTSVCIRITWNESNQIEIRNRLRVSSAFSAFL